MVPRHVVCRGSETRRMPRSQGTRWGPAQYMSWSQNIHSHESVRTQRPNLQCYSDPATLLELWRCNTASFSGCQKLLRTRFPKMPTCLNGYIVLQIFSCTAQDGNCSRHAVTRWNLWPTPRVGVRTCRNFFAPLSPRTTTLQQNPACITTNMR